MYIPIIKTGEAEIRALSKLTPVMLKGMIPIIELTRGRQKTRTEGAKKIVSYPFENRLSKVKEYLKKLIKSLLKDMGFDVEIEITVNNDTPTYRLYSTNDALLIGKDGKNLKALTTVVNAILTKEINTNYRFLIDVSDYKEKNDRKIERLAKKLAREVKETKVEVKMDSMNSYQRRLVHNILNNNKYVYTESVGEEPNRCVVIKPRD